MTSPLCLLILLAVAAILPSREVDWKTTPTPVAVEENNVDAIAEVINGHMKLLMNDVVRGWDEESNTSARRNVQVAVCLHQAMAWKDPVVSARLADAVQDASIAYVQSLVVSKVPFDPKSTMSINPWLTAVCGGLFQSRATHPEKSQEILRACISVGAGNYALLNAYEYMPDDKLFAYIRSFDFTKRNERYQLEGITDVVAMSKMTIDDVVMFYNDKAAPFAYEKITTIEFNGVVHIFVRNLRKAGIDELALVQTLDKSYRAEAPVTTRYACMALLAYIMNAESIQDGNDEYFKQLRKKIAEIVTSDRELNVGFLGDMVK
jgi:hypothetical protein